MDLSISYCQLSHKFTRYGVKVVENMGGSNTVCWQKENLSIRLVATHVNSHDDIIKWKKFPHHWPFGRDIHRSPAASPHKIQWRGSLIFSLTCTCKKVEQTIDTPVIWGAIAPSRDTTVMEKKSNQFDILFLTLDLLFVTWFIYVTNVPS